MADFGFGQNQSLQPPLKVFFWGCQAVAVNKNVLLIACQAKYKNKSKKHLVKVDSLGNCMNHYLANLF